MISIRMKRAQVLLQVNLAWLMSVESLLYLLVVLASQFSYVFASSFGKLERKFWRKVVVSGRVCYVSFDPLYTLLAIPNQSTNEMCPLLVVNPNFKEPIPCRQHLRAINKTFPFNNVFACWVGGSL